MSRSYLLLESVSFVDEVILTVRGGRGGDGCVSFHREKFRPKMGPDGGDGGKGGNVWVTYSPEMTDLLPLAGKKILSAPDGKNGEKNLRHGKSGKDIYLQVPEYSYIFLLPSNQLIGTISRDSEPLLLARGGKGGKGNAHFSSPVRRAPLYAQKGQEGEVKTIRIEWHYPADIGILGEKGTGKTSLLRRITGISLPEEPTLKPFPFYWKPDPYKKIRMIDLPPVSWKDEVAATFFRHLEKIRILIIVEKWDATLPSEDLMRKFRERKAYWKEFLRKFLPQLPESEQIWVVNCIVPCEKYWKKYEEDNVYWVSLKSGEGIERVKEKILHRFQHPWEEGM
ncbi:MAG: hypothetical protein V2G33_00155 [bacterium JZ-2024 1]